MSKISQVGEGKDRDWGARPHYKENFVKSRKETSRIPSSLKNGGSL